MSEENPSLSQIRKAIEQDLGYRVSTGVIRTCMKRNNIPIRRRASEAELIRLREQNAELRRMLEKISLYADLPSHVMEEVARWPHRWPELADALRIDDMLL